MYITLHKKRALTNRITDEVTESEQRIVSSKMFGVVAIQ